MIREEILKRILILDGAMGTAIQQYGLTESDFRGREFAGHPMNLKGNNDILNLTKPEIIRTIHQEYIKAGADIIETNTFNSNAISQHEYQCTELIYRLNFEGAKLAREAADGLHAFQACQPGGMNERPHAPQACIPPERKVWVAGSIGPTSKTLSLPT